MELNHVVSTHLNVLAADVHALAKLQGWWDKSPSFPEIIALCHSELSEALEAYRNGKEPQAISYLEKNCTRVGIDECSTSRCAKPEGIPIELADCILRILDYCGHADIDIDTAISIKHQYNQTRPYRHGGKKA